MKGKCYENRGEKRSIAPPIPNLCARWGWAFNAKSLPLYPQERPGTPCGGGLVGVRAWEAQSVQRLAMGWTVWGSKPVGSRFSTPVQTGPEAHPASYTMGTGSFSEVNWPGRGVDHPPHLAPRLKKAQSYTSTSLLGLHGLFQGEIILWASGRAGKITTPFSPCFEPRIVQPIASSYTDQAVPATKGKLMGWNIK